MPNAQPGESIDVQPSETVVEFKMAKLIAMPHLHVVRMDLPAGKEIAEHQAPGELIVHCLAGHVSFATEGKTVELKSGELLYLPHREVHAVTAIKPSSLLLTLQQPQG